MNPRQRTVLVIAVVVIAAAAGVGGYLLLQKVNPTCRAGQTTTICVDQAEVPDSLDPAVTFSTPGWAAVQQVYQGLVNYNGTSSTSFVGVLAKSWTTALNPATGLVEYNFTLRSGAHFSNGDPYNAYVQWYSFYRSLLLAQGPQFILEQNFYSTNFSTTAPLNFYVGNATAHAANATLVSDLNSWNFFQPNATALTAMETADQSFQVVNSTTIRLNLGYGYLASNYTYLLASLSAPNSYAVDPSWIDQNGGVVVSQPNSYLATHTLGTGPYILSNYNGNSGGGYTLTPDSNYWGKSAASVTPWNNMIQPANTSVDIIFQSTLDVTISDLQNGIVQTASFAYIGPSTVNSLSGHANLVVRPLSTVFGATSGSWWIFLNQTLPPFNNLSVRAAVAHAINYTQIIDQAFGGNASRWVGPVPPSYPYYNPQGLTPYSYNLTLAHQEIQASPCRNNACAGTTINYEYLNIGADWSEATNFLVTDLAAIGLTLKPVPISLPDLYVEQALSGGACQTSTGLNGGPFYMGQEFYTSDYISPDDWTQNDALSTGSANVCMSGYHNSTLDATVYRAAAESNPTALTSDYSNLTSAMYTNYTDIWLVVPTAFDVHATNLHGIIENPMASAEPFSFLFNTMWLS